MNFDTAAFKYFPNYIISMSVTEGLAELNCTDDNDYYKIIYIKTGPTHFIMNEKEFVLSGACAICMNEQDSIEFIKVHEEGAKVLWFKPTVINANFTFEVLNNPNRILSSTEYQDMYYLMQFTKEAVTNTKILSLHTIDATNIEHRLHLINELLTKQSTNVWPCRSRSYLFEILFSLARQEEVEDAFQSFSLYEGNSRLAVDVVYYLQSCYDQKITIEKLAEEFHTNRTTLLSDFKKYTGQSINQYLIELRLTMASTLLRDTELTVEEISDRSGFRDISYFSKVFKKKLYHTPIEYRKITN